MTKQRTLNDVYYNKQSNNNKNGDDIHTYYIFIGNLLSVSRSDRDPLPVRRFLSLPNFYLKKQKYLTVQIILCTRFIARRGSG